MVDGTLAAMVALIPKLNAVLPTLEVTLVSVVIGSLAQV
jgi:hypothetical protein